MAKDSNLKDNPVAEALKKLKEEEAEIMQKLKPLQEAIVALEKIIEKSTKKVKSNAKEDAETVDVASSEVAE